MMEKYKIKVNNEAESKEAQELFKQLGYKLVECRRVGMVAVNDSEIYPDVIGNWDEYNGKELTIHQLRDMVSAHRKPTEQGLISGSDALRAIADGKEVEHKANKHMPWGDASLIAAKLFSNINYQFRLKPRTIKLELEIPAPFEPKDGEIYWHISPVNECGYKSKTYQEEFNSTQFGAWRTEEEIKQVVEALRGALKNG